MYGIVLDRNRRVLGQKCLPKLFFNSVSALSSEIEGRSYHVELLKIEPREADKILVPSLTLVADLAELVSKMKDIALDRTKLSDQIDSLIFQVATNLPREAIKIVQASRLELFNHGMSRNKSVRAEES